MNNRIGKRFLGIFLLAAAGALLLTGCVHPRRGRDLALPVNPGDQPDKILYGKATNEIHHGRYDVGRLTLQTLINTYPDSEFLSKAKLAIADSYYSEGGVSGLTQAQAEYKDFITFFPTAPEAPEAQFRVGMAHFRLMAKADRDRTEARLAEAEFKEFLLKYPDSPWMPRAKARLRETQEVLGQGDFKTATFYYNRGAFPAARSRFQEIIEKYPNYSGGDAALMYLGRSYEHLRASKMAVPYYSRILTDFPLSPYTGDAKARLKAMHQPIPKPTRAMLARAQADAARRVPHRDLLSKLGGAMSSGPDTSATLRGPVRIGQPQPGSVEVAKTTPATVQPGTASIAVSTVGEGSLNQGKAIDPKPAAAGADNGQNKPAATSAQVKRDPPLSIPPVPKKKRSAKTLLKKLNPF